MAEETKAIRLHVTQERYERMTLNDMIALEEMAAGKFQARKLRDILARFVVTESGTYMPDEEAQALIGELPISDLKDVAEQFGRAVEAFTQESVPPGGGRK